MALKEYLYLDTKYLNSSLAQLGEGLMTSQHSSNTKTDESSDLAGTNISGGVGNFLKLGFDLHKSATESASNRLSESTQEVIDSVLDDHAIQILQDHLADEIVQNQQNAKDGDFVKISSRFKIYDFNFLSNLLAPDNLDLIKKQDESEKEIRSLKANIERFKQAKKSAGNNQKEYSQKIGQLTSQLNTLIAKQDNSGWDNFALVKDVATFFNEIFPDSIIIKMDNALIYCDRTFFRENAAQLSMLATSTRQMTIFGSVMSVTKKRDNSEPFREFEANELNKLPALLSTIMLSNFEMLDDDITLLVRPLAISLD
ncbi:DUF6414 family protein [Lapidilactobacillus gannanensis]|uniref:Uncharacterized protein n=1 Tax=Lapidilactobacillus gannanensis TaxID=2486002 RepID=A0ABW4BLC5_9LACO|nr:hypothetical protein [Lapidilactobacillus gannanensis]